MESTASLCEKGNCVLAGHNGSRRGTFFTNLGSVRAGTEVNITTKAGVTHRYMVEEMRVVNPYEEWVTEESNTEVLTLFFHTKDLCLRVAKSWNGFRQWRKCRRMYWNRQRVYAGTGFPGYGPADQVKKRKSLSKDSVLRNGCLSGI